MKTPKGRKSLGGIAEPVKKSASNLAHRTPKNNDQPEKSAEKRAKRKSAAFLLKQNVTATEIVNQGKKSRRPLCPFEMDGFRVLPWKMDEEAKEFFQLLYKEHKVRKTVPEKPLGKTLFVSEVPPCLDEVAVRSLFSRFGDITEVFIQSKPSAGAPIRPTSDFYPIFDNSPSDGYRVAYVVFQEAQGMTKALEESFSSPEVLKCEDEDEGPVLGLAKYVRMHNRAIPDEDDILAEAKKFLHNYEVEENTRLEEEKRQAEPDDAGWVTVGSRGTKRGGFSRSEAMERKIDEKEKRKKPRKELLNFYTFQVRESKMKNIEELQKRFEQDKRRLELMKQNRKFKPY